MKIGNIEIKGHVVLGPMAGYTTLAYREFMKPFGVGLSVSEMISDCGIDYNNQRTFEYLATSKSDRPVALQIFGFSAENSTKAIRIIEERADYDILDLNFGCPVFKVTKTGAGSSWLKDPEKLYEYTKAIVETSSKPVTAKIRLGWDENSINVFENVAALEKAGVAAICVHCRTKAQGYAGVARYEAIAGLRDKMSVPLIVSGDIFTPEDAKRAVEITHADAVMVARGGLGNPYLVTQINHYLDTGERLPDPTPAQQIEWAEEFIDRLIALKGEVVAVKELRGILPHFIMGYPGFKAVRIEIAKATNKEQLVRILEGVKARL